jgi:hypothetical protein
LLASVRSDHTGPRASRSIVTGRAAKRTVDAEAGDGHHDQAREVRLQFGVAQAPLLQRAGLEVLDNHVCVGEKPQDHIAALGCREVQGEALLIAVQAVEHRRLVPEIGRSGSAALVTRWRFDLDDVSTEVAQHLCAEGAGQDPAQIQYADAVQRELRGCFLATDVLFVDNFGVHFVSR